MQYGGDASAEGCKRSEITAEYEREGRRPNGLRVSRAAPLDRDRSRADLIFQKSSDLARREAASATPTITAGRDSPPEKPS